MLSQIPGRPDSRSGSRWGDGFVAPLSDEEAAQLARQIDNLPAGADAGIGPIVGAIVLVFLVLLITDLLGLTKVFPFTRPIR